jgi:hypothetical protein
MTNLGSSPIVTGYVGPTRKLDCMLALDAAKKGSDESKGLQSMRERARMLGGNVRIDSEPGAGTRVGDEGTPRRAASAA